MRARNESESSLAGFTVERYPHLDALHTRRRRSVTQRPEPLVSVNRTDVAWRVRPNETPVDVFPAEIFFVGNRERAEFVGKRRDERRLADLIDRILRKHAREFRPCPFVVNQRCKLMVPVDARVLELSGFKGRNFTNTSEPLCSYQLTYG